MTFTGPFHSNGRLCWLHNSDFQSSCHNRLVFMCTCIMFTLHEERMIELHGDVKEIASNINVCPKKLPIIIVILSPPTVAVPILEVHLYKNVPSLNYGRLLEPFKNFHRLGFGYCFYKYIFQICCCSKPTQLCLLLLAGGSRNLLGLGVGFCFQD
jgi:hypothetical protein